MARTRTHALPALAAVAMGALTLLASTSSLPAATPSYTPAPAPTRRLRVALRGAPARNFTAANASLFKSCGVTDAWIPYLQGAFAGDCCKAGGDAGARAHAACTRAFCRCRRPPAHSRTAGPRASGRGSWSGRGRILSGRAARGPSARASRTQSGQPNPPCTHPHTVHAARRGALLRPGHRSRPGGTSERTNPLALPRAGCLVQHTKAGPLLCSSGPSTPHTPHLYAGRTAGGGGAADPRKPAAQTRPPAHTHTHTHAHTHNTSTRASPKGPAFQARAHFNNTHTTRLCTRFMPSSFGAHTPRCFLIFFFSNKPKLSTKGGPEPRRASLAARSALWPQPPPPAVRSRRRARR